MNLQEVMTYNLCNIQVRKDGDDERKKSSNKYYVNQKKEIAQIDVDDILMVRPYRADDNGKPMAIDLFTGKAIDKANWRDDYILIRAEKGLEYGAEVDYYNNVTYHLVIPDSLLKKETFVGIIFKHVPGTEVTITLKDWKKIQKILKKA